MKARNYHLTNTGKREFGGSFNALFHQPKYELLVSGSYLDQELGILRGSIVGNLDDLRLRLINSYLLSEAAVILAMPFQEFIGR